MSVSIFTTSVPIFTGLSQLESQRGSVWKDW